MRLAPLLLALALGGGTAMPAAAAEPTAQEIGYAFAAVVGLPGEVSLAAASLAKTEPRFFLTQRMWRELETGNGTASPEHLVGEIAAAWKEGRKLSSDPGPFRAQAARFRYFGYAGASAQGAQSMRFLLRNKRGRWIAFVVIWNGEAADEAGLALPVGRLLALMAEG